MPLPLIIGLGLGLLGLFGFSEYHKKRIKTKQDLVYRYTLDEYLTIQEIENKKYEILKYDFTVQDIVKEVKDYRRENKFVFFSLGDKKLYICTPTEPLQNYILFKDNKETITTIEDIIDEAFYSAVIEGAHSTRKRAEGLIVDNLKPLNKSEQMILNNYKAIEYIKSYTGKNITRDFICNVHKIVTQNTLDRKTDEGVFRNDIVEIHNTRGGVIFTPTKNISNMYKMLDDLIDWVNTSDAKPEINLLKTIVFHFAFGYIHPFFDGNGRTARILSMFLLIRYKLDYLAYLPMAKYIQINRKKYEKAFLNTEWNEKNHEIDVTYFMNFMLKMYSSAMTDKKDIIQSKVLSGIRLKLVQKIEKNNISLTRRQVKILEIIIKESLGIQDVSDKIGWSYATVSKDMAYLMKAGVLSYKLQGRKKYYFISL